MTGRLAGIARHGRPRGPIETLNAVMVTVEAGLAGDYRGAVKPGGKGRRQVTVMAREDWDAALVELGRDDLDWSVRRANLLSEGIDLPRRPGARLVIGDVVLEVTGETDPCSRMEEIAPGLRAVLTPDWRGGVLTRVVAGGQITVGDMIRIEEPR